MIHDALMALSNGYGSCAYRRVGDASGASSAADDTRRNPVVACWQWSTSGRHPVWSSPRATTRPPAAADAADAATLVAAITSFGDAASLVAVKDLTTRQAASVYRSNADAIAKTRRLGQRTLTLVALVKRHSRVQSDAGA